MMDTYADMPMMAVWYSRLSYTSIIKQFKRNPKLERLVEQDIKRAQSRTAEHVCHKIVTHQEGAVRIVDQPPLLFHVDADLKEHGRAFLHRYRATLRERLVRPLSPYRCGAEGDRRRQRRHPVLHRAAAR